MDRVFFLQLLLNTPPPYLKRKSIFVSRGLDLGYLVEYQLFQAQFNSLLCKNVISEVGYGRSRGEVRIEGDVYEEVDFVFPPNGRMNIFKASQNINAFSSPKFTQSMLHDYSRLFQPPASLPCSQFCAFFPCFQRNKVWTHASPFEPSS